MVAITRIGTAHGGRLHEGHPALGPDEDGFTLVAAAAEAALAEADPPEGPTLIDLIGSVPETADWALPLLLGTEGGVSRSRSFVDAIDRSGDLRKGRRAMIAEFVGGGGLGSSGPASAIAVLVESAPGLEVSTLPASVRSGATGTVDWLRSLRPPQGRPTAPGATPSGPGPGRIGAVHWTESNGLASSTALPLPLTPAKGDPPLSRVSEGAYIPRARYLESIPSRWRFEGQSCSSCGSVTFPARGICSTCGRAETLSTTPLPKDGGRILALTTIGKGGQPTEFDPWVEAVGAYPVAIVELAPGARATLQVSDWVPGTLGIGDRVSTRLRRLYAMEGEWRYGRKAIPWVRAESSPAPP